MSLFNDNLKNIKIKSLAIFILGSYLVLFVLGRLSFPINEKWLYVAVLFYFIFKLKDSIFDVKTDSNRALRRIIVEALAYPNLKDKELMDFRSFGLPCFSRIVSTN